ncbi:hypothetical protein RhiirA4_470751 [Rhizophagus irregularis]|uniref:Uncharacterized protein n=1 Tax=Rhizophagus irregularis TaxID=588596 RepID=A0A2I1GZ63_9GLOM|nr:hypothetical protein RhiirA4_469224 [Rhizophagus irregularis]PKY52858.1 hypothetical protein RhiirA4_470751 [Rhizophagus irregularis]
MAMNNCANTLANNGVGVSDNKNLKSIFLMLKIKYNLLYEIIKEINKKIEESTKDYKKPSVNEPSVNDNQEQETTCIYDYFQDVEEWTFQEIENETIQIDIFEYAYLLDNNNKIVICASPNYYGKAIFSDVCIEMDEVEQGDYLTNDDSSNYTNYINKIE